MNNPTVSHHKFSFLFPLLFVSILLLSACTGARYVQDDVYSSYSPPPWAPAYGYRADTRYVFFPEIGVYYDLYQNNYIYPYGNSWAVVRQLPPAYSAYDLRRLRYEQLNSGENPQNYAPGSNGTVRDNPSQYTPRRGGVPRAGSTRNIPPGNQRRDPVNPPVNTPRLGNQSSTKPVRTAPNPNNRANPSTNSNRSSPNRGDNLDVRSQQPGRKNQIPSRVAPPKSHNRGPETQPSRTHSRRGGGAI